MKKDSRPLQVAASGTQVASSFLGDHEGACEVYHATSLNLCVAHLHADRQQRVGPDSSGTHEPAGGERDCGLLDSQLPAPQRNSGGAAAAWRTAAECKIACPCAVRPVG